MSNLCINKDPPSAQCCSICGKSHKNEECDYVKVSKHIPDSKIPSKAKLSVPSFLELQILTDGSYSVVSKVPISKGSQFGPFIAEKRKDLDPAAAFPLKLFDEESENDCYLDITDENKCNWLIFVDPAENAEEQNLISYQDKDQIYYVAIKDIARGGTLKVWYSPHYASKMKKLLLNSKIEDPLKNLDINTLIKKQQKIMERKVWTCKFCSQMENNIVSFAKHILQHYTARLKKTCEICKKNFNTNKSLKNHMKIVHFSTPQPKPSRVLDTQLPSKDIALGGPLLNDMFSDSSDLQQFDLTLDNQNLLLDSDLIVENLLNENVKDLDHFNFEIDDNQKHFVCDICLKQFSKVKLLIVHLRHHTGDFICPKCLKIFCRKENLKSHICNTKYYYICTICGKGFTQRKYLTRHIDAIHEKKFNCPNCKKSYHSKKELTEHNCSKIPLINKEKFICPFCDKTFYRELYLKRHMKTHGAKTKKMKQTNIICEVCGCSFIYKNSWRAHMKKHQTPLYSCDICERKFYRFDTLKEHKLSHNKNENNIECGICHKKIKTVKILKSHLRHHKAETCYQCNFCDSHFKFRPSLKRHIDLHHNNMTIKYYNCPICNKSIKLKSSLLRHLRRIHSDVNELDLSEMQPQIRKFANNKKGQVAEDRNFQNFLIKQQVDNGNSDKKEVEEIVEGQREICLSIPDLTENDQEITLDKNAYILENGTIVQPQGDSDNVVIYVLDQTY